MSGSNSSAPSATDRADPLVQLSVHELPAARLDPAPSTWQGRLKMLLVLAICAAPVLASYLSYYVIRPSGRVNYGDLIVPPAPMPADADLPLRDLQGKVVQLSSLKGQWLLVTVAGGACDAACEHSLYWQRQLRETLGKEKDRLDRVWLIDDEAPVRAALMPGLAGAWVLRASAPALQNWLKPQAGQALRDHFYLVDPKGLWMMRFAAEPEVDKIKRDLARLMKANESWDEPGR